MHGSLSPLLQARITEMHFFLRSISDSDLLSLRRQGRLVWERYCSSVQSVVDTVVAVLRDRLAIPPLPIQDEPSPSVFNSTFTVSLAAILVFSSGLLSNLIISVPQGSNL
jgi:hypothetical protein